METLINKINGQVIEIISIQMNQSLINYRIYDNGIYYNKGIYQNKSISFNTEIKPEIILNYPDFINFIKIETLKQEYKYLEESNDCTNWVIKVGSTGAETTQRVLIPNSLMIKYFGTNEPIMQLIEMMKPFVNYSTKGELSSVQYLEYLLPEHKLLLEMYEGIIIENKY